MSSSGGEWGGGGTQGKAMLPKGEKRGRGLVVVSVGVWGGGGCGGGETKELLWMEVYDVNPFLSPLHTNNKKPA